MRGLLRKFVYMGSTWRIFLFPFGNKQPTNHIRDTRYEKIDIGGFEDIICYFRREVSLLLLIDDGRLVVRIGEGYEQQIEHYTS